MKNNISLSFPIIQEASLIAAITLLVSEMRNRMWYVHTRVPTLSHWLA